MYDTILEWGMRTAEKVGISHDLEISSAMKEPGKDSLKDLFELLA
eukprot:CAMPEP_0168317554 /NCGR_PEP_ID=MMETSP0210-20121227/25901_1 /TAXON_ID=40633 /ORGANISM="Condylostoma magnum, Strain COL2" /LENGTH=44 /DNA_ID= /DNA_START= /DNA_END= /DNA_ORIENTATION=